ncbi:uncharacterized protein LOC131641417 [Vicia villosa]|uniref:uncharacterized protein LOC131641417 n=1 Tax=Vicia villosa TaxID=3911 RepID=UPI00273C995D|nr:uncharacterized protein LOC131641417 [Vicia villosa]
MIQHHRHKSNDLKHHYSEFQKKEGEEQRTENESSNLEVDGAPPPKAPGPSHNANTSDHHRDRPITAKTAKRHLRSTCGRATTSSHHVNLHRCQIRILGNCIGMCGIWLQGTVLGMDGLSLTVLVTLERTLMRNKQPGFKQMKILRQERLTVCFIEFESL